MKKQYIGRCIRSSGSIRPRKQLRYHPFFSAVMVVYGHMFILLPILIFTFK